MRRRIAITIAIAVAILLAAYWWNHVRLWTLHGTDGRSLCRVQSGWTQQEVAAHCGPRSGKAVQPKVPGPPAPGDGVLDIRMCSAPADIYNAKVVLYGCDGKVQAVEDMPASGVQPLTE